MMQELKRAAHILSLIIPTIEAFATFLTHLSLTDHFLKYLRRSKCFRFQLAVKVLCNVQSDIQTNKLAQLQRTYRVVISKLHRRINVLCTGNVLFEHPHCLESESDPKSARGKSWNVAHGDRFLSHSPCNLTNNFHGLVRGFISGHNLNQAHQMHGIEKMKSDNRSRPCGHACDLSDRPR